MVFIVLYMEYLPIKIEIFLMSRILVKICYVDSKKWWLADLKYVKKEWY